MQMRLYRKTAGHSITKMVPWCLMFSFTTISQTGDILYIEYPLMYLNVNMKDQNKEPAACFNVTLYLIPTIITPKWPGSSFIKDINYKK